MGAHMPTCTWFWWEETHVLGVDVPGLEHVVMYHQYIDDLFVWADTGEQFERFIKSLEDVELNLRFTSCFDANKTTLGSVNLH